MPSWVRAAIVLVGLAVGAGSLVAPSLPVPAPVPVPQPVGGLLAGLARKDADAVRAFYEAMADIVVRDGKAPSPVCKSTLDLRNRHMQAMWLAFAYTDLVGKYEGLGERLDAHLMQAIGDTDVPLTPEVREKAAAAFLSVR